MQIQKAMTQLNPTRLFNDRMGQWSSSIPKDILENLKDNIQNMNEDSPGGWEYEFSVMAKHFETTEDYLLASKLYGLAKYPIPTNSKQRKAYRNQLTTYIKASETFPCRFERKVALVKYKGITTPVTYHVIYAKDPSSAPVVMMSGGIDTYKMDTHGANTNLSQALNATVVVIDIPGTGESQVLLAPENDEIYKRIIEEIRPLGNGKVAYFAYSFGAYWAVRLAFEKVVDVAVAVGALVNDAFLRKNGTNVVLQKN